MSFNGWSKYFRGKQSRTKAGKAVEKEETLSQILRICITESMNFFVVSGMAHLGKWKA
jgi:hypothetical protein